MKHLEVHQKYSAARRIFNSLLSVSSGDETLCLMFDNYITWKMVAIFCMNPDTGSNPAQTNNQGR